MTINNEIARAVRYSLLMGAITAAGAASSALAADAADNTDKLEEVIVTGSRIAQPNLTNTSPVIQVTAADIQAQGVTRIEDLITQLPQAFAAQNSTVSNGSNGTATVDLRGLGSQRTLVLVDGRRMPYGAVSNSAADLNQIPTGMVERVDVLTGGASAVYGSDAIGGVVNFIMKKDFEGIEIDAQAGLFQHNNSYSGPGSPNLREVITSRAATNPSQFKLPSSSVRDGYSHQLNLLMGVNSADGKGNITAYAGVRTNDAVLQANRDYSACTLDSTVVPETQFFCGGSSTSYPGRFLVYDNLDPTIANRTGSFTLDANTPNTFRNFSSALDRYNFGPLNYFQRPDTTYNLGAMGHYEINPHADAYTQLMFTDYESVAQIAPGGDFGDTTEMNCANPLMSASQKSDIGCSAGDITANSLKRVIFLRRNVEGGGRQAAFHNSTFRALLGVKGAITKNWNYDASLQFSRLSANQKTLNFFVTERIKRALNVVDVGGVPTCQSVVDGTDPNCVPYNAFLIGGVTPAALNYVQAPGVQIGVIDQKIASFNITGDNLFQMPTATSPAAISFGYEGRRDSLDNTVDALQEAGALSGSGGATHALSGQTKSDDLYLEFRLPLVNGMAAIHDLSLDFAYRNSNYGHSLTTDTYKVGVEWAPVADIRLRASYQRAVRAPNIIELFTAQGLNLFDNVGDPCGASQLLSGGPTAAQCIATGVPAGRVGDPGLDSPAGQYNFLQGGSPGLKPETSDTKSFGIVLQPRFAPGLSLTVDYFNISIKDTISQFGSINTLDACYQNKDAAACGRIHRAPSGSLWLGNDGFVENLNINIGGLKTTGVDFVLNYDGIQMGRAGRLGVNVTSTHLITLITEPGGGFPAFDCAGFFTSSCAASTAPASPKWRHHARVNWHTPVKGLDAALTLRYLSGVDMFGNTDVRIDSHLDAYTYLDMSGSWAFTEKASVRAGVNNILDKDPPLNANLGTTGNGNTYPQIYDGMGRYAFVGMTYKF